MKNLISKKKIVPRNNICSICYSNLGKNYFKCENNRCIDGVICKSCQKQYQEHGLASRCPICRNSSDAFIVNIADTTEAEDNTSTVTCKCKFKKIHFCKFNKCDIICIDKISILCEKNCFCTTISMLFITLFIGYIECTIFQFAETDPIVWFFSGLLTIIVIYLLSCCICTNFCYIIHCEDE